MGSTSGWQTKAKAKMGTVYAVWEETSTSGKSSSRLQASPTYLRVDGEHPRAAVGLVLLVNQAVAVLGGVGAEVRRRAVG